MLCRFFDEEGFTKGPYSSPWYSLTQSRPSTSFWKDTVEPNVEAVDDRHQDAYRFAEQDDTDRNAPADDSNSTPCQSVLVVDPHSTFIYRLLPASNR